MLEIDLILTFHCVYETFKQTFFKFVVEVLVIVRIVASLVYGTASVFDFRVFAFLFESMLDFKCHVSDFLFH